MAHCDNSVTNIVDVPAGARRIVLAGNPNVGKSVFFNSFTGLYVDVSNYPGTTLDISQGRMVTGGTAGRQGREDVLIDTPGVYGLSSWNDEERIARDGILGADVVINVVDAVHLERDLFLTQQIIDTGVPVIVALNMLDEARRHGLAIDDEALAKELGVPVVPTVATRGVGLKEVKQRLNEARPGRQDPALTRALTPLQGKGLEQGEALLVLEGDPIVAARNHQQPGEQREQIYLDRRRRVNGLIARCVAETSSGADLATRLGRWMIRPATGIPILLGTLWLMYELVGVFVAGSVVNFLEKGIMQVYYEPFVRAVVSRAFAPGNPLYQILAGEFGVLTMTVTYVIGLLAPLVIAFYIFLSILEDSGYLPRIATLVDRALGYLGLNGRAIIPIILGFGCVTMATLTTRMLGSEREKRIATVLLGLAIPCSAQLGVITGLLAGVGPAYVLLYLTVIGLVLVVTGTLLDALLPGRPTDLLIDLPPLRLPRAGNVLKKTWTKAWSFLTEATPLFAAGALLISVLQVTRLLDFFQTLLAPLTVSWLHLPRQAANAFIMGIVRRDFGAAGLYSLHLSPLQTIVALVTITLFVPCIASVLMLYKERGRRYATNLWIATWVIAFGVGGVVAQAGRLVTVGGRPDVTRLTAALAIAGLSLVLLATLWRRGKEGFARWASR
ncbi:MAG: ferrous iron transport protein B [Symbiobacteriia bacterium]